jgi:starch synthase
MRVLFVTSEVYPLAKSGGLADVSSALAIALTRQGIDVHLLLPGYPGAIAQLKNPRIQAHLEPLLGVHDAALISGQLPGSSVPVLLIYAPSLYSRSGGLYQDKHGQDWADNALRFAFLARVAAEIAMGRLIGWTPDVVHGNDWHAGLIPLLISRESAPRPATVFTVHNLAFQGNFPREILPTIGMPDEVFTADGVEYYGQVSYLKTAIHYSDKLTTVSPTYAKEVLTPEFGCGFDGVLRARGEHFTGILNGIDSNFWDSETDSYLPHRYSARSISGKRKCKAELQDELGLSVSAETPLIGFVSRLAHQKMADVILEAIPQIIGSGAQFALVSEGDSDLEAAFEELGRKCEGRVGVHIGYDEAAAHRLQAGSEILLAPARFEPCGLSQLYALRYGTVPVVRRTGGLADTVTDATAATLYDQSATGFVFDDPNLSGLLGGIRRALAVYKEPLAWRRLQLQAMAQDFSCDTSAAKYMALYRDALGIGYSPLTGESMLTVASGELERQVMR